MRRCRTIGVGSVLVFGCTILIANLCPAHSGDAIAVTAARILNFHVGDTTTRFGRLEFVGGLELQAEAGGFGGFSGLRLDRDRVHFVAVTDRCKVLDGILVRDITGTVHDVSNVQLRPLPPGPNGKAVPKSGFADCEALEISGAQAFVGFEYNSKIARFDVGPDGSFSNFASVSPQPGIGRLVVNRGIEAIAIFPQASQFAGSFIAIAEETFNAIGNHRAFIIGAVDVQELAIEQRDGFAITDADFLPNGDLVILERRFGMQVSPGVRIRQISAAQLVPAATAGGRIIMEATLSNRIDNMEGIDASADATGQIYLTLISDNNFNYFQSNLLLEFKLLQ